MQRRTFLKALGFGAAGPKFWVPLLQAEPTSQDSLDEARILETINSHRPTRLKRLPSDFRARVGATHVAGKYHLTDKPFLLEGGEKLLELGTTLGKFWFSPRGVARDYPFNSRWGQYENLVGLAQSEYFQQLFSLPFATFILEVEAPVENGWKGSHPPEFYQKVAHEFYELTAHLYKRYRDKAVTFILQHWEGDWLLRGRGGALWDPPPADWGKVCAQMQQWLGARQAGVAKARAEVGTGARCRVAHAAEVNRVADIWKGIPTMTDKVLPQVTLDLVSYSAYDGLKDPLTLWKCIAEIKRHAKTTGLFGSRSVYLGEVGVPENEQPKRLAERWDEWLGVALAAEVSYLVHWELYCNELNPKVKPAPKPPIRDANQVRGFWLVRPDGSLSESGKYFHDLWQRAAQESREKQ